MHIRSFNLIFLLLLLLPCNSYSQGSELKERNVIIKNCVVTYTYKIKNKIPVVKSKSETNYLCSAYKTSADIVELYTDKVQVDKIKINSNGGKTNPQFAPYIREGMVDSDYKMCYFTLFLKNRGDIANVLIEKTFADIHSFSIVHFTEDFFCENKIIRIIVPRWMKISINPYNCENITSSVIYNSSKDTDIYEFQAKNLESWIKEENSPGTLYTSPHLLITNHSSNYKSKFINYFSTMEDLYTWNHQLVLDVYNDLDIVSTLAESLTTSCTSDQEKISIALQWVQNNIRYMENTKGLGGYQPESAQDVIQKKYGDCKGMSNLLKCMLQTLGLDARLAWIGTNDIPYDFSIPNISMANHMICVLFMNNEVYYLDPTVKYLSFDNYSETIQNQMVMIENGENFLLYTVPKREYKQNSRIEKAELNIEDKTIVRKVNISFFGESKNSFLYLINYTKKDKLNDSLIRYFSNGNSDYAVSDIKIKNTNPSDVYTEVDYSVADKLGINIYNNKYYITPDINKEFQFMIIDTMKRKTDYHFPYKHHIVNEIKINIPQDLKMDFIPEATIIKNSSYSFKIEYLPYKEYILYRKELIINNPVIKKENFENWNKSIEKLKAGYKEQIVLTKL